MYRIGIIGTENSHALAFAKYYNLPNAETGKVPYENVRVVAVFGTDEAANQKIVEETGVEFVAEKVEDLLGRVDGVMITSRRGSEHMAQALPFIDKKIPLFIDKPFTSDPAEADALMAKLLEAGCPVQGGSACKYLPAVQEIKKLVAELRANDEFVGAAMSFRVQMDSPYDGTYFYAPHLVEMCLEAFGPDVKNIQAMRTGMDLLVNAQYEKDAVSLHFVSGGKSSCVVFGKKQNHYFAIDTAGLYALEAAPYAELLQGNAKSLPAEMLTKPVHMIAAIDEAWQTGKVVAM